MGMSRVQLLEVNEGDGDQRLDRWFRRQFPQVQQGQIEKMCRKGDIRVDGGRVKSNTRVEVGQMVRIPPLPDTPAPAIVDKKISDADAKMIQSCVLYRDEHIIALNKPPGLPVQGGSKQHRHVDGLTPALRFGNDENPRLVHRLDKDTSGVLILGRVGKWRRLWLRPFGTVRHERFIGPLLPACRIRKWVPVKYGLVKASGHGSFGEGEKMHCLHPNEVATTPGAKRATTDYAVLSPLGSRAAWVALVPVTWADASAAGPYGRNGASDCWRWQIWRLEPRKSWAWLGCAIGRRDQQKDASTRQAFAAGASGDPRDAVFYRTLTRAYAAHVGSDAMGFARCGT
jgi:23S rRNA pseudouridine955/2504/2580 synthase